VPKGAVPKRAGSGASRTAGPKPVPQPNWDLSTGKGDPPILGFGFISRLEKRGVEEASYDPDSGGNDALRGVLGQTRRRRS
jgi:hypothetical protein